MIVKRIEVYNIDSRDSIADKMADLEKNPIAFANWIKPEVNLHLPQVYFKIAHNGEYLFLHYFVHENEILALTAEDNGSVWTDSCVEFFVSFADSTYYYNAEFSCIGRGLLGYRKNRNDSERAGTDILSTIKRIPSLGVETFGSRVGDFSWNILLIIPASAYWKSGLRNFSGVNARANFYKCGDKLAKPHYLSWKPIDTATPNFHLPQFFGELIFEK